MRDIPRQDTQPDQHSQLLLCMFKPFFSVNDLRRPSDASWAALLLRVAPEPAWDPRTKPFRMNVVGMLKQRREADEESPMRRAAASAANANQPNSAEVPLQCEVLNYEYDDNSVNKKSVLLISRIAQAVIAFVNDFLDRCLASGFCRSSTSPPISPLLATLRGCGTDTAALEHLRKDLSYADGF